MTWLIVLIVLAIGAVAVLLMLRLVADRGGFKEGDAGESAGQVVAQMAAFRMDDAGDRAAWDGVERLKGVEGNDGGGA